MLLVPIAGFHIQKPLEKNRNIRDQHHFRINRLIYQGVILKVVPETVNVLLLSARLLQKLNDDLSFSFVVMHCLLLYLLYHTVCGGVFNTITNRRKHCEAKYLDFFWV